MMALLALVFSLMVLPQVASAPVTLYWWLTVPRNAENRVACLLLEGPEYHESCWELPGSRAPVSWSGRFVDLPAGSYTCVAELRRRDGSVQRTFAIPVQVL